ncbi:type II toxin-antitoxin system HicB family antitoxin [Enterococcus hulanensis]|uniref:type II toxin-antitoxin system HicB family antitoxin n=1 Tax=Enterococcus hulanensis TaxID=2559929 RepID=UPI000B5A4104|nr:MULTISPECIES: type II toxin-antitoxin system HicB family antitoxin [Enterococcus]MBO0413590.1 type II toxin-antitoxin system HicB family antitoxin [Enterococcus hulanensis]MDT2661354.1 type II toxin-antitoxin system HicB family antitoxin [Enterococcus hulanensis]OTO14294.1 hypothetical protein A5875_003451 [Enterococcus sp. 3H8_DIV0648]
MFNGPLAKAYPAIFHREENGGYFIEFPDVQGAYTGINEDDIAYGIAMAEEVLGMVLADMIEHDDPLPAPTPIKNLKYEESAFATHVRVDVEKYFKDNKMVRKTLTIPQWAENMGQRAGINFSQVLTDAISQIAVNSSNAHHSK